MRCHWRQGAQPVGRLANRVASFIEFFRPGDDHGSGGVGHSEIYFDGDDGRVLGNRKPWTGTAADIFVQAQFPVHSGRILGIPGRILISVMGLVVAMLSVTGVYIWYKKRLAHLRTEWNRRQRVLARVEEGPHHLSLLE